jgi:hypothetical protein
MAFHLDKGGFFISVTTYLDELLNGGDTFLGVFKFGSDPQSRTTDELIVFDVHNPAGDVSVDDVECQVESFRTKAESEVDLYKEIDETGPHVPTNLWLLVH